MATLQELRKLMQTKGVKGKAKTKKKREDGVVLIVKGIADHPTPQSRAELARLVGAVLGIRLEDGTNESTPLEGDGASEAVIGTYNAEPAATNGNKPPKS